MTTSYQIIKAAFSGLNAAQLRRLHDHLFVKNTPLLHGHDSTTLFYKNGAC